MFNSNYVGRRVYINLLPAQVGEQLDAVAATDVCGVTTTWIWQLHCKWKCTRSGKGGTTNRRSWSTNLKEMTWNGCTRRCRWCRDDPHLGTLATRIELYKATASRELQVWHGWSYQIHDEPQLINGEQSNEDSDSDHIITGIMEQLYVFLSHIERQHAFFLDLVLMREVEN